MSTDSVSAPADASKPYSAMRAITSAVSRASASSCILASGMSSSDMAETFAAA